MKPTVLGALNQAQRRAIRSGGFSLVELMVAMVIGMLGIVVMMQVFSVSEAQKRTTTSGDDAISSGAVSLYGMQREIQQSGWGISGIPVIGCTASPWGVAAVNLPLAPVTINSPLIAAGFADANTETLLIVSGSDNGTTQGDAIASGGGASVLGVHTPTAFVKDDWVIGVPRERLEPCVASAVRRVAATPVGVGVPLSVSATLAGELLFNLGAIPRAIGYAVSGRNLMSCDFTASDCTSPPANWVNIASNVVSLRAQYGHDTGPIPMTGVVGSWDRSTPTTGCGFVRTPAVRIAIVARSSQPEKADSAGNSVTPVVPPWAGSVDTANTGEPAANVAFTFPDPDGANWPTSNDFRYKVFQTVVPLRNITSMGAVDGC